MPSTDPTPRPPVRRPAAFQGLALAALVGALAPTAPTTAQTILNVERLQPGDVRGWHWGVEGSFALSQGNTEYVDFAGGVALGHRWPGDWLRVFAGLDYRSETDEALERDQYLHVRFNHWLAERWQTFHFVQLQKGADTRLQRRLLLGSGLRHRISDGATTLDVGTGAMYEEEDLDPNRITGSHPLEARVWRMANLVVATRSLTESVRLVAVGYIQPDVSALDDVRTLTDLSLLIALTENVDLSIRGEWRHDSRPPANVVPNDAVLRTGFTFSFR